jgi:hypothetical protein
MQVVTHSKNASESELDHTVTNWVDKRRTFCSSYSDVLEVVCTAYNSCNIGVSPAG